MGSIYKHIKAVLFLLGVCVIWGTLILACLPVQVLLFLATRFTDNRTLGQWHYSLWMNQDQFTGWFFSGHHETTISSAIGERSYYSRTAQVMRVIVDWVFNKTFGQVDHCRNAIQAHDTFRFHPGITTAGIFFYVSLGGWFYLLSTLLGA